MRGFPRRAAALLEKELFEHGLVLFAVTAFLALGWGLLVLAALGAPTTMSYFDAHAAFMRFAVPILGLALGNRLVVLEVQGRTQRFLESLPMRPLEPLVVKWAFGLVFLGAVAGASLVATSIVASLREPITAWFLTILAARTFGAVLVGWTYFFSMGLFGKLRVPLYLLFFLGLVLVSASTSLELMHFGPFALLGPDFPLERDVMPVAPLVQGLVLTVLFLAVGLGVATLREGSVEERLGKPMSQRDLVMAGIASFAILVVWGQLMPEPEPAPYVMSGDHVLHARTLPIAIGYLDDDARPDAEALLSRLEDDVGSLAAAAGWTRLPQLRVALRRSLDGDTIEPVGLARDDGALLRANFLAGASPDLDELSAQVLASLFDARTGDRATLEPRRWVRDGLAVHWAGRRRLDPHRAAVRGVLARWASRGETPSYARLARFEVLREERGARAAAALAGAAFDALERRVGAEAIGRFAAAALPAGATEDLRVTVRDWLHPVPAQLEATTGIDTATLATLLAEEIDRLGADPDVAALEREIDTPTGEARIEHDGAAIALVGHAHAAAGTTLTVRHVALGPSDRTYEDHELSSESQLATASDVEVRIDGRYTTHDRVLVRVDLEGTALGVPLRLAAERVEVE